MTLIKMISQQSNNSECIESVYDDTSEIKDRIRLKRALYQRNKQALCALHEKYFAKIVRYIATCINSITDAEDIAQDIFVELCKSSDLYDDHDEQNADAYLFGVAKNFIRQYRRNKNRQPKTVPIGSINEPSANFDIQQNKDLPKTISLKDFKKTIEDAMDQLPPKAQEAIKLRFIEKLSTKEAAEKAGCPVQVFCQRVYDAKKRIKKFKDGSDTQL